MEKWASGTIAISLNIPTFHHSSLSRGEVALNFLSLVQF
jgi:hypothetical protein